MLDGKMLYETNFSHPIFSSIKVMEFFIFFLSLSPTPISDPLNDNFLARYFRHRRNLLNFPKRKSFSSFFDRAALKKYFFENAVRGGQKSFFIMTLQECQVDVVVEILHVIPCCKMGCAYRSV